MAATVLTAAIGGPSPGAADPAGARPSAATGERAGTRQQAGAQPQGGAQRQVGAQQPAFGARIARVRVDAIVTGDDGNFVGDLRREDFRVTEDGEPQEILGLQLIDMSSGTVTTIGGRELAAPTVTASSADHVAAAPDDFGALIFVIDGPGLGPRAKRRFANAWIELLDQTASLEVPRAVFMIDAAGNLEGLTAATFDLGTLRGAADAILAAPSFGGTIHRRLRLLQLDMQNDFDVSNLVRAEEQAELNRSLDAFSVLAAFCDALAARPGRTALVWVSSGVKLLGGGPFAVLASRDPFEQLLPDRRIQAAQQRLHEAANSANVSIYGLDPTLKTDQDQFGFNVETQTSGDSQQLRSHDLQASLDALRDSLRNAAEETGGRSFIYGADVGLALATIRQDSLRYYLLTYAPPRADGDGRYHDIEVRVERRGVRVRARDGYVDWPESERRRRNVDAVLAFPEVALPTPNRELAGLLGRLERLASIHAGDGLRFSARETIVESSYGEPVSPGASPPVSGQRVREFDYVRDPDDPSANERGGLRRRVGAAPDALAAAAALEGFELSGPLDAAYSWPSLFRRAGGGRHYLFEIAGTGAALGRPATLLAFLPAIEVAGSGGQEWFGTAWVDAETSQLLRVHALSRADYSEKVRFVEALAGGDPGSGTFEFTEITTEYWEEHNGLRFPGQVTAVRNRFRLTGSRSQPYEMLPVLSATQTFIGYEFAAIPSAEEIRRWMIDGRRVARDEARFH